MIIFVLFLAVFFKNMKFGRDILATGGNEAAAALSGIRTDGVQIACNTISCEDWMLYSFAICAIGGINLSGGNFTAIGFFCGSWILTMIRNGLTMMKVDIYYEQAFLGAIILLAVSVESLRTRISQKMG